MSGSNNFTDLHLQPEQLPQYSFDLDITEYEKRGEGMGAYVVFKVVFKPHNVPVFSKPEYEVWRRFSDFLGLYEKLAVKHAHTGRIVPPAPEKDVLSTARTKVSEEESSATSDFLERRRSRLERFLKRVALHPILLTDVDFRDFVTLEAQLPRATHTSAFSGTQIKNMFKRVGDALNKSLATRMDENDRWFEQKQTEVDSLYDTLFSLQNAAESLVHYRRECAQSTESYSKSLSMLAACEENSGLARALSQLAETQEKIGLLQRDQAEKDFYLLSEMLHDYLNMLSAVRTAFDERIKVWQHWQAAEVTLNRKREEKTRLELAGKSDKVPRAKFECEEAEKRVGELEEEFGKVSKMIRSEMVHFDSQRVKDFKKTFVQYLESLAVTQQQLAKYWEAFLPEARAIIT